MEQRGTNCLQEQFVTGYFLLRSVASNKARPTITLWNKEIRTAYGNSLLPAIFYIRTGELCSPAGRDNSMVNPHVFIQGLKTGERSSPLQWFPHQPQARFRCKACPNNTGAKRYQLFTQTEGYRLFLSGRFYRFLFSFFR